MASTCADVVLDVNGADLAMETSSGVSMDTTYVKNVGDKFEVSAANFGKNGG